MKIIRYFALFIYFLLFFLVFLHSLSLIQLFNGFHFRGNLFTVFGVKSYLCYVCSWNSQVRSYQPASSSPKSFLPRNICIYDIFQATGRSFSLFWMGKSLRRARWRHAGSLGCWSVLWSTFWVHISLILMRALMSA